MVSEISSVPIRRSSNAPGSWTIFDHCSISELSKLLIVFQRSIFFAVTMKSFAHLTALEADRPVNRIFWYLCLYPCKHFSFKVQRRFLYLYLDLYYQKDSVLTSPAYSAHKRENSLSRALNRWYILSGIAILQNLVEKSGVPSMLFLWLRNKLVEPIHMGRPVVSLD